MRMVIINKSDSTGGAAVVSRRLMEALRREGVDAKMLVLEKLTDSPFVCQWSENNDGLERLELWARLSVKFKFLWERLKIFLANGLNKSTLFKIDTGEEGLPLWKHPLVKDADAILINWVNQGMLSLKGFQKILELKKPVIWTMHDMWEMTGICHHAWKCRHFEKECGNCELLGRNASSKDLSHKVWERKNKIYSNKDLTRNLTFVAVSSWLKEKAMESSLLKNMRVEVIPNAFDLKKQGVSNTKRDESEKEENKIRILFGAARLDDPIKGLDTLKETARILNRNYPETASRIEIAMFGSVKDPDALNGFELPVVELGVLRGEYAVRQAYETSQIVVSASSYETLPGTLVEAQAYGCIPVSFNQGGQKDIVKDGETGFIVDYSENLEERAGNLAKGILKAIELIGEREKLESMKERMRENVEEKFAYQSVAREYMRYTKVES